MVEKRSLQKNDDNSTQLNFPAVNLGEPSFQIKQHAISTRLQRSRFRLDYYWSNATDVLHSCLRFELAAGLAFNMAPLFLAVGIIVYFVAPAEPDLIALVGTAAVFLFGAMACKFHGRLFFFLAAFALAFTGMMAAKISVLRYQSAQIEKQMTAEVAGIILSMDHNRNGSPRLLILPEAIDGIDPDDLPSRVRISTTTRNLQLQPGMRIEGIARLRPVSGPVFPGSYDFSFFSWFSGLGGSGFFMGQPSVIEPKAPLSFRSNLYASVSSLRGTIRSRVTGAIPGDAGKIAVALIIGDKTGIPKSIQNSLRNTGLAHILAISGLHMALVTLTVIWGIRIVLSLFPGVVLRFPVSKWAACAGFSIATAYLVLSGAGIATQRAWIMISVMLLSVLLDRRAITIRSVAVSASVILIISPQNIFAPGFQMSFAAVVSLVAGYEALTRWRSESTDTSISAIRLTGLHWIVSGLAGYVSGIFLTSLIAGTATAFVAAWHFHQIAPLGLLANMLAMPIVGFIIMPFALASILLMPYGFEWIALVPVDWGINLVISISQWVEGISPAGVVGAMPSYSLAIFGLFLTVMTVFKSRLRFLSLTILPILLFDLGVPKKPHVLVSENGRAVFVMNGHDKLVSLYPRRNRFVTTIWGKAWAGGKGEAADLPADQCNNERCIVVLPSSLVLHVVYNPDLLKSSCNRADILIAPRLRWVNCRSRVPQLVLKRHDFEQRGSHAIYIEQTANANPPVISLAYGLPDTKRPWGRQVRPYDNQ